MKTKIKAESVEQLLQIVKAVQSGEEPEKVLQRQETESAPEADSPKPHYKERNKKRPAVRKDAAAKKATEETAEKAAEETAEKAAEETAEEKEPVNPTPESGEEISEKLQEKPPEKIPESTPDEEVIDRLLGGNTSRERLSGDKKKPEKEKRNGIKKRINSDMWFLMQARLREFVLTFQDGLESRGIHKKELFMLGAGFLLVVLIFLLVGRGIRSSITEKKKSEHVTADSGLVVAVESEPQVWSSSYPVVLSFRARGKTISKVTVGDTEYVPDEQGQITVEAEDYLLYASATTEDGELTAQIELPMLDAQAPVVNVSREANLITVKATDARSGVAGVWYAAVQDGDFSGMPFYQKYSEAIPFEKNTMYYFYAEDEAGNRSHVLETTTETARDLTLQADTLSCFPGETRYLKYEENPSGALLNNLKFESGDPSVALVDSNGAVTAVKEGATVITVSADGVASSSCRVEVSRERTVTISAIGDCTLGTDESFNTTTNFNAFDVVQGHAYFFQKVKQVLEKDDVTFANMEGTLTTETTREAKQYAFKGDPSYTEVLKSGSVEVVTLANNHSSDYGAKSLSDTKEYLTAAGIEYCTGDEIVLREVNGIQTAFIGIYVLDDGMARETQVRETIASAKARGAQLVVVAFHWGSEKATQPDDTQQALGHLAIDCGADLVVGHHPHVLQGIEKYNGKYIVYSLGNFCFGGNSAPSDTDTMIFRQTFTIGQDEVVTDDNVEIIPCKISSVDGYNNYQPMVAEGTEADRIVGRINEYSEAYGQRFTASGGM